MKLTEELIQELRRLSDSHNEPVLADAAERLEMCDKSHSVILRLLKHTKEDLDEVQTERDKMLEDMLLHDDMYEFTKDSGFEIKVEDREYL